MDVETVVSADGTRIAFRRLGSGPPVVALHGGLGSWRSWEGVARQLADRFEFLLVDRRGRGDSDDGVTPHALEREVEDARAVLAVAGGGGGGVAGRGAALLGHSYGGAVALELARTAAPGELGALLLYEPAVGVAGAITPEQLASLRQCVLDGAPEQAVPLSMNVLDAAGLVVADGPLASLRIKPTPAFRRLAATVPDEISAVAALGEEHLASCAAISAPTLLLIGSESPERAVLNCRALAEALPGARVVTLAGLGHVAHTTAPERVAQAIGEFLARV
ncbi:alpha/beta hydrolase [Conexibacter stalactiti]|uniref:Alpha/beta hydrolase n=1 Tax=Conexibacter stalactiti TaxID=1940611 RepID=A0ABU4HYW9_9ACTN|nr:alpha/beta hydrolase [Conexibacter stalactiti]MDW5598518.1 alpha/beta hydrolase [Conexibacter stalactiti]MEC5039160.1 alpha/beta hydrolase [Conexibacter stalactiti]